MSFAYQVSNNSYQGAGVFAYQGGIGVVQTPSGSGGGRKRRYLKTPRVKKVEIPEEIVLVLPPPELIPEWSLGQVLKEMKQAEFDIIQEEEEDDALIVTLLAKTLQ